MATQQAVRGGGFWLKGANARGRQGGAVKGGNNNASTGVWRASSVATGTDRAAGALTCNDGRLATRYYCL